MTETEEPAAAAKKPPKGGRKGGTLFPKLNLKQAVDYSKKLVSKTHTGPQPEKTILPGVFGEAGGRGKIRASALKQYGLLEGPIDAYKATQLAKEIDAALVDDLPPLLQRSFLSSKLFSQIFETFHGDTVSKAKIEQRAKGLGVHPESAGECAQLFMDSAVAANAGTAEGDSISLVKSGGIAPIEGADVTNAAEEITKRDDSEAEETLGKDGSGAEKPAAQVAKPGVNLNLTVDPSSDPDKLEKQLRLLRQYGVI